MAAQLRVVASSEAPGTAAPAKTRRTKKKAPAETPRERRNRLARERRARKKAEAAEAPTTTAADEPQQKDPERELTLLEAFELGDQLVIYKVQRREAARSLPGLSGQSLPAMHRQIAQLTEKISALESAKTEGTDIGDAIDTPDEEFDPHAD